MVVEVTEASVGLKRTRDGLSDMGQGLLRWQLWGIIGWYDVRQHYRRSVLGPFWFTLSMAIMVGVLGFLYGALFGQPLNLYLSFPKIPSGAGFAR
jgi:ABC-type polysaccharide/polyol phosphate export permease